MTTHPDFERLMAYVDGELDAEQAARLEADLASDDQARALVDQLRATDALLRQGLDEILAQPIPQRLLDTLREPARGAATVIPLRPRPPVDRPRRALGLGWAAAAGVVLAIAVTTATVSLLMPGWPGNETIVDNRMLREALETLPSGTPLISGTSELSVMPLATYRSGDARPCREVEARAGARVQRGLACRDAAGRWDWETLSEPEIAAEAGTPGYVPASGEDDPISSALDRVGAGAVLSSAEERALIDTHWSHPRP